MAKEGRRTLRTRLEAYQHLLEINAGYEQVIRSLAGLEGHAAFHRDELKVFSDLAKEARASASAYLTEALQTVELAEAGRRFRRRLRHERRQEGGE